MDLEQFMLPCVSKLIFGLDCPGCGMQRSLVMLIQGNFSGAFKMFPAIFTTVLFFLFVGLHFIDKRRNYHRYMVFLGIGNATIMIIAFLTKIFII